MTDLDSRAGTYQSISGVRVADATLEVVDGALAFEVVVFHAMRGDLPPIRGTLGADGVSRSPDGCVRAFVWDGPDHFTVTEEGCPRGAALAGRYMRQA